MSFPELSVKSSWTRSSGVSSTILISSSTTFFSRSMSSAANAGADDVGEHVDRQRQVLVEHLDVVAGVFLGGERIHLAADGVDRLRDVLGDCASAVPLKSMCSTKWAIPLCSCGSCREPRVEPDPDAHRPHVRHPLGDQPETVREHVTDDAG